MTSSSAPSPAGDERRRHPRFAPEDLSEPVSVVGSRLVNISLGGLMLEAPVPLATDSSLRLNLVVNGEKSPVNARVRACVPWSRGARCSWGLGVEFESMPATMRERLAQTLAPRRVGRA